MDRWDAATNWTRKEFSELCDHYLEKNNFYYGFFKNHKTINQTGEEKIITMPWALQEVTKAYMKLTDFLYSDANGQVGRFSFIIFI